MHQEGKSLGEVVLGEGGRTRDRPPWSRLDAHGVEVRQHHGLVVQREPVARARSGDPGERNDQTGPPREPALSRMVVGNARKCSRISV
jgi:hypothetical protein